MWVCGIRVVFAYNYLILFFVFLYPRNLPPGHITKPFLASATQLVDIEVFDQHQDDHSDDKCIYCLCHLPALVNYICVTYQSLLSM